jgi:hypothetical protein
MAETSMSTDIITQLKTGSIKRVVLFGDSPAYPAPPYVVLKYERDPVIGRRLRIIGHANQGQQDMLDNYMFGELTELLKLKTLNRRRIIDTNDWTDTITGNDDNTISMERIFALPMQIV